MATLVIPPRVWDQIRGTIRRTAEKFGKRKASEYQELVAHGLKTLEKIPASGQKRPELRPKGLMTLHIARQGKKARHLFVYRITEKGATVECVAFLYDGMDYQRHIPKK